MAHKEGTIKAVSNGYIFTNEKGDTYVYKGNKEIAEIFMDELARKLGNMKEGDVLQLQVSWELNPTQPAPDKH